MARKTYSEEFRRDAVELYPSTPGATVVRIAGDLGTMDSTLSAWLKAAGVAVRAPGSATRTDTGWWEPRSGAHAAPFTTSTYRCSNKPVLRRPVESRQYPSKDYATLCAQPWFGRSAVKRRSTRSSWTAGPGRRESPRFFTCADQIRC